MSDQWKSLVDDILEVLKQSAKEYINEQGVKEFLQETAERYAKWKWKALTETDPAKKHEYEQNLIDVMAQVDMEVARHAVASSKETLKILAKIASVVGQMLLKIGPKLLGLPI